MHQVWIKLKLLVKISRDEAINQEDRVAFENDNIKGRYLLKVQS
jgi:hypothetical protein